MFLIAILISSSKGKENDHFLHLSGRKLFCAGDLIRLRGKKGRENDCGFLEREKGRRRLFFQESSEGKADFIKTRRRGVEILCVERGKKGARKGPQISKKGPVPWPKKAPVLRENRWRVKGKKQNEVEEDLRENLLKQSSRKREKKKT